MKEKIKALLTKAMKEKDVVTRDLLRYVNASILLKEKESKKELTDAEIIDILKKEVSQQLALLDDMIKYNVENPTLAFEIGQKVGILNKLIPQELSEAELSVIIENAFEEKNYSNMGEAMKDLLVLTAGQANKAMLSRLVKAKF